MAIHTLHCSVSSLLVTFNAIRMVRVLPLRWDGGTIFAFTAVRTRASKSDAPTREETGGLCPADRAVFFRELDVLPVEAPFLSIFSERLFFVPETRTGVHPIPIRV